MRSKRERVDLQAALKRTGLTQSGLARTMKSWGDPRSYDVVLRWVQRAFAGHDQVPYIDMVLNILDDHIEARELKYVQLNRLESGNMRMGENLGGGWQDTTAKEIEETKRQIRELDGLLAECKLDPPVNFLYVTAIAGGATTTRAWPRR